MLTVKVKIMTKTKSPTLFCRIRVLLDKTVNGQKLILHFYVICKQQPPMTQKTNYYKNLSTLKRKTYLSVDTKAEDRVWDIIVVGNWRSFDNFREITHFDITSLCNKNIRDFPRLWHKITWKVHWNRIVRYHAVFCAMIY